MSMKVIGNTNNINTLTTIVPHHIETSQLIWRPNQLTCFYMMRNICRKWVNISRINVSIYVWYQRQESLYMGCVAWFCTICNLKNLKNTHGGVLLLVNFTESNTPPWVFFAFCINGTKSLKASMYHSWIAKQS